MMANPKTIFKERGRDELTNLQLEIIEALAKHPKKGDKEIAEIVGCSRQYVTGARTGAEDLIEELRDSDELDEFFKDVEAPGQDSDANGKVKTESGLNSFEGKPIDLRYQKFDERPNQNQLTEAQLDFVDELSVSDLERQVIRTKLRNPDFNASEIAEVLEQKTSTVSTYLSQNRHNIEEAFSIPHKKETNGHYEFAFSLDEVLDILSSDTNRELKEKMVEELTA